MSFRQPAAKQRNRQAACAAALCLLFYCGAPATGQAAVSAGKVAMAKVPRATHFVVARGIDLWQGKLLFRNIGVNIPDLFVRFLNGQDSSGDASLKDAQAAGVLLARCFGTVWSPDQFGIFMADRARWFGAFDRMLAAADARGIGIVPSLLFNIRMIPDYVASSSGGEEDLAAYLTPGTRANNLAVEYVSAIVGRYKNDPRVLFWEIGNEYNLEADLSQQWKARPAGQAPTSTQIINFLKQMATLIHRIDKRHLVTSGNADMRSEAWHMRQAMLAHASQKSPMDYAMDWTPDTFPEYKEILQEFNPAPIDIISVHQYPPGNETPYWLMPDDNLALVLPWTALAAQEIGKPLFVGEFGEKVIVNGKPQPAAWTVNLMLRITAGAVPIGALWSWEYDETNPAQAPYSISPGRAPGLVSALGDDNHRIVADQLQAPVTTLKPRKSAAAPKPAK
ncbi:MAG TPA: cellulase family glycosylhydrolase [Chthonomonadales bacterium]|nr:cellulase family glycosylhydrolase [Chthonomonadales bacterium]